MKLKHIWTILVLTSITAFGNINFIKLDKVVNSSSITTEFNYVVENQMYFDHWEPNWSFDIKKKDVSKELKRVYKAILEADASSVESNLLLGDIAHYLYNLHEEKYFDIAVNHYNKSLSQASEDYRTYWFLANHYAHSSVQDKSIELFIKSQKLLPQNTPAEFWNDFSFATALANMPAHTIFAMDQSKQITGKASYFEEKLGESILNRIEPVYKDSIYADVDIWKASVNDLITFVSKPMGIKLLIDSTWNINLYGYKNGQSIVTIGPPALKNKLGREITYTVAIIMKVATEGESLENFIGNFTSAYSDVKEFNFSDKYSDMISFEIKSEEMYQEIGGAHMHMIGISRNSPKYPGLLLEKPVNLPQTKSKEIQFYRASNSKARFDGKIHYAIMLDACEDIYDDAYALFHSLFEEQIVIE